MKFQKGISENTKILLEAIDKGFGKTAQPYDPYKAPEYYGLDVGQGAKQEQSQTNSKPQLINLSVFKDKNPDVLKRFIISIGNAANNGTIETCMINDPTNPGGYKPVPVQHMLQTLNKLFTEAIKERHDRAAQRGDNQRIDADAMDAKALGYPSSEEIRRVTGL